MTDLPATPQFETAPETARLRGALALAVRWGLLVSLAMLPFELIGGLGLPGLTLTNVELAVGLTLLAWLALLAHERRGPAAPVALLLSAGLLVLALLASALLAADERGGALKFALRQAQGALFAICIADRLRIEGAGLVPRLALALLAGGGLSALLGLAEMGEWPPMLALLGLFKEQRALVGGFLRLSGTFTYANTAAMYFEALLPLALLAALAPLAKVKDKRQKVKEAGASLALLAKVKGKRQKVKEAGASLALLAKVKGKRQKVKEAGAFYLLPFTFYLEKLAFYLLPSVLLLGIILTYSRAALVTSGLLLLLAPLVAWRTGGARAGRTMLWACGGLLALGLGLFAAVPALRLRLSEPDVARWYSAAYRAEPLGPLAPRALVSVPITVENRGLATWSHNGARPFRLSYHWLASDQRMVRFEGRRTALPQAVAPGEQITLMAVVQAPDAPGDYLLAWDMVRENMGGGWFSQFGTPPARVAVAVRGQAAPAAAAAPPAEPPSTPRTLASIPPPPDRRALWAAAIELWRERPLLGIGPDVFRHIYGPRIGLASFDDRVHTNNLYLELLTGAGLLGLASFGLLIGQALWRGIWALWQGRAHLLSAAAVLGLAAFLIHGMLDVFLAFTPTYLLLWCYVGVIGDG
jgi:O-Antigen ligase